MPDPLTVSIVLGWDLRYLEQCVTIMLAAADTLETEAASAGDKVQQSDSYFEGAAGSASRTRGADDKADALATASVLESLAKDLQKYHGELESNISTIREQKKQAEESVWDLYVAEDGNVVSRKSNWDTYSEYGMFGGAAVAAKEYWTRRYDNLISAALTWIQRVDQEGAEIYIRNIEDLSSRVKEAMTPVPDDPELARIIEEYQTDSSDGTPRLFPTGLIADLLKDQGIEFSPSLLTAEEIAAMEELYRTQGISAVGEALKMPDMAEAASLAYSPDTKSDGHGDAFRHMYWNALMSQKFGEEWTEQYATAHEKTGGNNAQREAMDLWNNELGRKIGAANPDATPEQLQELVRQEIENGRAIVITGADESGKPYLSDQDKKISWSSSTDPARTGSPAGVGIPLPGTK